jgi:proteasome assembly chaperone (PAC2) family protein
MEGWIDSSSAAQHAMELLVKEVGATAILTFDPDSFIDFRARRPTMELREGVNTRLVWSAPVLHHGRDINDRDVLVLNGPEPDMAWNRFAGLVGDLAKKFGVRRMIGLGAYPYATPHTRTVYVSCTSPSVDFVASLPYLKSSVDVPAGMEALLEHAMHARKIPAVGLWARVPHYVSAMAYPAATAALLGGVCDVGGISIDASEVRTQATVQRERLDQLVSGNPDHARMLAQLEETFDQELASGTTEVNFGGPIPSGDELAAQFERYLREQRND